jgi:hypothetical protein
MDESFKDALLAAVLSGGVIAAVLGLVTHRHSLRQKSEIEDQFRRLVETRESRWALLQEVLGPVNAHLARTRLAFGRWREQNLFLEQQIIYESNAEIRRILLAKYHLLTPELRPHAMELVQHFDRWFEEFEKQRRAQTPSDGGASFVFVGPQGYPFPRAAEEAFTAALDQTYTQLGLATQAVDKPQR